MNQHLKIRFEGTLSLEPANPTPDPDPDPDPGTGRYHTQDGRIWGPDNRPVACGGINATANIRIDGRPTPYVFEGLPGQGSGAGSGSYDIWPGEPNVHSGALRFPGGGITAATVHSPDTGELVDLPDRAYALNGILSRAAEAHGIIQPVDWWHQRIIRLNAIPRGANNQPEPGESVPQYVEAVKQLLNLGFIVIPDCHNQTGLNISNHLDQRFKDAIVFQEAMVEAFAGDSRVWFTLPNEPWSDHVNEEYMRYVIHHIDRIRSGADNYDNIIVVPLAVWSQDLAGIHGGKYDQIVERLSSIGLADNLLWDWHAYGANTSTGDMYSYKEMGQHLRIAREKGFAVIVGEYGAPSPLNAGNAGPPEWNRAAVRRLATSTTLGNALAVEHKIPLVAWHGTGDATYWHIYKLCHGINRPDETAAHGTSLPIWDIDGSNLEWLTPFGRAHWDVSHQLDNIHGILERKR